MDNNGQQGTTMDNNEHQWTTIDNNGKQWTTMDYNGQQSAVLHASLMPFSLSTFPTGTAMFYYPLLPPNAAAKAWLPLVMAGNQFLTAFTEFEFSGRYFHIFYNF